MKRIKGLLVIILSIFIAVGCGAKKDKEIKYDEFGYQEEINLDYISNQDENAKVKNIILIIGDGMGENQVEVTKKFGLKEGQVLDLTKAEYRGYVDTNCLNNYVTDSAAGATAMATGHRTNYETVGLDPEGNELKTILDIAKEAGKSTGVITTDVLNGATPLGFTSHSTNRYLNGKEMIKTQLNANVDVLMGWGEASYFEYKNLIESLGYEYTNDRETMNNSKSEKLLSVFSSNSRLEDKMPSLAEMTQKAIDTLSKNEEGFVLIIEEGLIDKKCDSGEIDLMMERVVELDKALRVALNFMRSNNETLVITTADHETGGLIIGEGTPDISWYTEPTRYHTNVKVPVYAYGTKSKIFDKCDILNTDIFNIMYNNIK